MSSDSALENAADVEINEIIGAIHDATGLVVNDIELEVCKIKGE